MQCGCNRLKMELKEETSKGWRIGMLLETRDGLVYGPRFGKSNRVLKAANKYNNSGNNLKWMFEARDPFIQTLDTYSLYLSLSSSYEACNIIDIISS